MSQAKSITAYVDYVTDHKSIYFTDNQSMNSLIDVNKNFAAAILKQSRY